MGGRGNCLPKFTDGLPVIAEVPPEDPQGFCFSLSTVRGREGSVDVGGLGGWVRDCLVLEGVGGPLNLWEVGQGVHRSRPSTTGWVSRTLLLS